MNIASYCTVYLKVNSVCSRKQSNEMILETVFTITKLQRFHQ